jgi:cytidylate kinase
VAQELGWEFYGIELVDHIAREKHVHRELVAALDEHMRTAIDRYVDAFRMREFTESDYLREIVRAVSALGERGSAVILGRGAPFILPPERALRVLVVGPREARLARLARDEGVLPEVAAERLAKLDAERHEFLGQFHVDPEDPSRYDLAVSPDVLGMDVAAELVVRAVRSRDASS